MPTSPAVIGQVADAITNEIAAEAGPIRGDLANLTVARAWLPIEDFGKFGAPGVTKVYVIPNSVGNKMLTRGRLRQFEFRIDCVVYGRVANQNNDTLDAIAAVAERIGDHFAAGYSIGGWTRPADPSVCEVMQSLVEPLMDQSHLEEFGIFASVVQLTVRLVRQM